MRDYETLPQEAFGICRCWLLLPLLGVQRALIRVLSSSIYRRHVDHIVQSEGGISCAGRGQNIIQKNTDGHIGIALVCESNIVNLIL